MGGGGAKYKKIKITARYIERMYEYILQYKMANNWIEV